MLTFVTDFRAFGIVSRSSCNEYSQLSLDEIKLTVKLRVEQHEVPTGLDTLLQSTLLLLKVTLLL